MSDKELAYKIERILNDWFVYIKDSIDKLDELLGVIDIGMLDDPDWFESMIASYITDIVNETDNLEGII